MAVISKREERELRLAAYVWYLRRQGFEDEQPDEPEELDTVSGEPMDDERGPDEK